MLLIFYSVRYLNVKAFDFAMYPYCVSTPMQPKHKASRRLTTGRQDVGWGVSHTPPHTVSGYVQQFLPWLRDKILYESCVLRVPFEHR